MDHSDGYISQTKLHEETIFPWTDVKDEKNSKSPVMGIDADDQANVNMNEEKPEGMGEVSGSGIWSMSLSISSSRFVSTVLNLGTRPIKNSLSYDSVMRFRMSM